MTTKRNMKRGADGMRMLTDVEINRLTALGIPRAVRRDALIALNVNGTYSALRVRNARRRLSHANLD